MSYLDYICTSVVTAQRERELNGVISVAGGAITAALVAKTFIEFITLFVISAGIMFAFNEALSSMIYFIKSYSNN